jgi:hypothetical protein
MPTNSDHRTFALFLAPTSLWQSSRESPPEKNKEGESCCPGSSHAAIGELARLREHGERHLHHLQVPGRYDFIIQVPNNGPINEILKLPPEYFGVLI